MLKHDRSEQHYQEARRYLAGGVGSDFRLSPGQTPLCYRRGSGSRIYDVDGNEYIDYVLAAGPLVLGHCPPRVVRAVKEQHPDKLYTGSRFLSQMFGNNELLDYIKGGITYQDLLAKIQKDEEVFQTQRQPYLLYED